MTFDAGALIGIERGSTRMLALLERVAQQQVPVAVPAGVLAQAWRGSPRQALLARFLRADGVEIVPLDELTARAAGVLCGEAGTADVVDASVVLCARERRHATVVTSNPGDLAKLDPTLHLAEP